VEKAKVGSAALSISLLIAALDKHKDDQSVRHLRSINAVQQILKSAMSYRYSYYPPRLGLDLGVVLGPKPKLLKSSWLNYILSAALVEVTRNKVLTLLLNPTRFVKGEIEQVVISHLLESWRR
jgi:hypothetical protein